MFYLSGVAKQAVCLTQQQPQQQQKSQRAFPHTPMTGNFCFSFVFRNIVLENVGTVIHFPIPTNSLMAAAPV